MTPRTTIFDTRLLATVALGALTLGAVGCKKSKDADAAETAKPAVVQIGRENIAVAQVGTLESGPAISGALAPAWEATIRAEVAGPVLEARAEEGQRVAKGTLLARIDDTAIRDQLLSARSGVRTAEAAAQLAHRNLERSQALLQGGAIAERDLEQARVASQSADAQLADAQARLANAEKQWSNTQVQAPESGVVSNRQVQAGDVVQPGAALYTLVNSSSMKLEASVPAAALRAVRVGVPVQFNVTGVEGRSFEGRIDRVNPVADPTGQVRISVAIPNPGGRLVGGLYAEGRVASERTSALAVPVSAVDQRGLQPQVLRVKGGRVERVAVQLGMRDEHAERVEVRAGLAPGDTVLVGSAQSVSPGTAVRVTEVADRATAEADTGRKP